MPDGRPSLGDIFGVQDDRPPLGAIFGTSDFSDVTGGVSSTADDLLRKKREQMAQARQIAAAQGLGGPAPAQGPWDRTVAVGDRIVSGAAEGLASIPELAARLLPDDSPSAMLPSQDTVREVPADPYPTLGRPGGFFDLKAQREDIARQAEAHKEALRGSEGDPYTIAAVDTLAEAAAMAIPLGEGGRAAKAAEEAQGAVRFSLPRAAVPVEPVAVPGMVREAMRPESKILQVGEHADRAAQDAALGLRGAPGSADALARASLAIDEHAAPAPLPRREPPSLAEIFGDPVDHSVNSPATESLYRNRPSVEGENLQSPPAGSAAPADAPPEQFFRNALTRDELPADTPHTGTKNAVTEGERIARGLPEVEALARKSAGDVWAEARQAFEADPEAPRLLAARIAEKPRTLTPVENDLLLHDRMKMSLDHRDALAAESTALDAGDQEAAAMAKMRRQSIEQAMDVNDTALKRAGTEWSAGGQARQKLISEDYSPLYLRQRLTVAAREAGATPIPGAVEKLDQLSRQLADAQAQLASYEERLSQVHAEKAVAAAQRDVAVAERSGVRRAARETLDQEYEGLAAQLEVKARKNQSTVNMSGGLDPETVGIIGKMAKNRVQAGARGLGDVVDGIFQTIRPHIEGLEPREVRDAISGYGVVRQQATQSEAVAELAKIRQQARLVSKLDDLQETGSLPAPQARAKPAAEVAALQEKLRQVTRDLDANPLRTDAQRLAAMKTRLEKRITDAERGLAPRAARAPLPDTPETAALRKKLAQVMDEHGLAPDPDAARVAAAERATEKALADLEARVGAGDLSSRAPTSSPWSARLGEMRTRQAEFQAKLVEMRAAARPETDPKIAKLRAAERAAAKSVAALEKKVAAGDIRSSAPTASRWSPELGRLRQEQAVLRERLNALRAFIDPEAARLAALKKRLAVRETELTQQIAEGYIPKKVRRPVALDKDAIALQGKVNGLKRQADLIIRKQELAGRTGAEKALDLTAGWGRFLKLTGVSTLQKISAAAAERSLVFRPLEEFLGAGISKVPLVRDFAREAPIEGGGSLKAVAKSYSGFFGKAAREELKAHLRGSEGPLELALGKPHLGGETPAWMAYPGHIHAGLKAPAKIAGYEYAMEKQAAHYLHLGQAEKLTDPVVIEEMKARAWEHANRDIFMGDNAAVNAFRRAFAHQEGDSLAARAGKTVANVLMPIVKVPTNYALEATDYLVGLPKAAGYMVGTIRTGKKALAGESATLAEVVHAGLQALPEGRADLILRQLKKGSLGAGLIALGATGAVRVGGYYDGPRREGDLQPGQIEIAGHVVPHMILHYPALEALRVGGAIYRAKTLAGGLGTAAKGLAEGVPFVETPVSIARDLWGREPMKAVGQFERGMTIPPDAQRLARVLDQKHPTTPGEKLLQQLGWQDIEAKKHKTRGPLLHQLVGQEELGIPGLRDNVR